MLRKIIKSITDPKRLALDILNSAPKRPGCWELCTTCRVSRFSPGEQPATVPGYSFLRAGCSLPCATFLLPTVSPGHARHGSSPLVRASSGPTCRYLIYTGIKYFGGISININLITLPVKTAPSAMINHVAEHYPHRNVRQHRIQS